MTLRVFCCALFASLLSWSPGARAEDELSVAMLTVTPGPGVVKSEATAVETALVKALSRGGQLHVMLRTEADAALDAGRKKALARCKKDAACLAGIAGVLQAELGGTVDIAHVAKGTSVTFALVAVKTQRELARLQKTFKKGELDTAIDAMADEARTAISGSAEFGAPAPEPAPVAKKKVAPPLAEEAADEEQAPAPKPRKKAAPPPEEEQEEKPAAARPAPSVEPAPAPAAPARTSNGFVIGFEFGYGPWGADPSKIAAGAPSDALLADGYTLQQTAAAFTAPIDQTWRPDLNLHLGWNFFGYGSVEGVFQMSWWDPFETKRGGTGLVGGKATVYPLQFFLPNRNFDVGLEGGGGYSIIGGPTFGMDGSYAEFGVTGEYYLGRNISVELFYRLFLPMWNRFYVDYNNQMTFAVSNFTATWNTLGLGINFHVSP